MNKNLLVFLCIFYISHTYSQTNWKLLNPKPTANTGKEIEFVSSNQGYILTSDELLETTDSGLSWVKKRSISNGNDLSFYNNKGFIVGNNGYLLMSLNSGESWNQISTGFNYDFRTVNIIDENNIILSGFTNILKSKDGGNTWKNYRIPNVVVNKTFFVSELIGHAACENGIILKTIDGGLTWYKTQSSNVDPSDFFTVYFVNEKIGFASREHSEIYKTTDGGETWTKLPGIGVAVYDFHFLDENHGFLTGEYGATFKTIDGGNTWSSISFQGAYLFNTSMYGIYFEDSKTGYATGARGRIIKTTDGGNNWVQHSFYKDINQIKFFESGVGYAQVGNDYYKTTDNGDNWTYVSTANHYSCSGFFFVDENTGYSIGGGTSSNSGDVFKTTNGGITWDKLKITVDEGLNSIYFIDENIGYISGGYNRPIVMKTIDGGNTWNPIFNEKFGQIQFLNNQVGYANRIGYANRKIFKTTDGGNNWNSIFEITEGIRSFHFVNENTGYIIGDNALFYRTTDGGVSWQKLLIPYEYYKIVRFHSKNIGYIVDEEGRIYKTTDGGRNWEFLTTQYGTRSIDLIPGTIYTAGSNGKIYRSNIDIFSIKVTNETCAGKDNGSLLIEASGETTFTALINNQAYNFTQNLFLEDLPAGDYSVCISMESNPELEQCFEFIIEPGVDLKGTIQSQNFGSETLVNVDMKKGTAPFSATLDGIKIGSYNSSNFVLITDKKGKLEISSSKFCEGKLAFQIENLNSIVAFPNPASSYMNIFLPETLLSQIPVFIYNNSGQLIYSDFYIPEDNIITLKVAGFTKGIYFVVLKLETSHTIKFSKE